MSQPVGIIERLMGPSASSETHETDGASVCHTAMGGQIYSAGSQIENVRERKQTNQKENKKERSK